MIKKLTLIILLNFLTFNFVNAGESTAYFVRSSDIKTVGQGVKLYIGKKYIGKVWTNNYAVARTETGKRKITTKVGLSVGIPITGLGGAKKFKSKFVFTDDEHYFKIKFKMGKLLFPGQHEVIEISKSEYLSFKSSAKEIKYKSK